MGHGDELLGPLAMVLAQEPGHPVFGDDRVGEEAGHRHQRPRLVHGHDARDGAAQGGGGEQGDGPPAPRQEGAQVGLRLATGAVDHARAEDALGVDLAQQVHRQGVVDGVEALQAGQVAYVQHVFGVVDLVGGVADHPPQLGAGEPRPGHRHRLARVQRLAAAVGDALLHQVAQPRAGHLGVDAQVVLAVEGARPHHIHARLADADLDGGAVGHQLRQVAGDGAVFGGHLGAGQVAPHHLWRQQAPHRRPQDGQVLRLHLLQLVYQRLVLGPQGDVLHLAQGGLEGLLAHLQGRHLHEPVNVGDVDVVEAVDGLDARVHLGDDRARPAHVGALVPVVGPEVDPPLLVGRGDAHQGHVYGLGLGAPLVQGLELGAEQVGQVGGPSLVVGRAGEVADEQLELDAEEVLHAGLQPARVAAGGRQAQLQSPQLLAATEDDVGQDAGPGQGEGNPLAGLDAADGVLGAGQLTLVLLAPVHSPPPGVSDDPPPLW
mgnify:CR=1 FL=1